MGEKESELGATHSERGVQIILFVWRASGTDDPFSRAEDVRCVTPYVQNNYTEKHRCVLSKFLFQWKKRQKWGKTCIYKVL